MTATPSRILVTGGAGFLGSHLCARLLREGHQVICLDNFFTGSRSNIAPLRKHSNFSVIEQDVCSPISLEVDAIYHLACPASPPHYQADPVQTTKTCVLGSLNMLELAKANKAAILTTSTSEVYGDPLVHPQPESYLGNVNPIGPRACYDEGKRCAETLFFDFHRHHSVRIKVVRVFNTYGPNMHPGDGRVVSNFIVQALQRKDITIYGSGEQTRSFCYVDDLIEGIVRMMATSDDITGPVNLGNPGEFTIRQLAEKVLATIGSSSKLTFLPAVIDDPRQRQPDISRARALLGWEPKVNLNEGLPATIAYFRSALEKNTSPA